MHNSQIFEDLFNILKSEDEELAQKNGESMGTVYSWLCGADYEFVADYIDPIMSS